MNANKCSTTINYIIYAFFITCLFILVRGYQFNTDDQAEHLPQVYQLIDPSLYQHDYFVTEYHQTYSLRSFYVWLVYGLSFIAPVSLICFLLTLFFITLSVYSFMRISTYFSKNSLAPYITPIFIYFLFYKITLGGNNIECSSFICSTIALSLAAFGLLQFFRGKYYLMAAIIGIGTLFQVMDAAQPFFLIYLFMLTEFKRIGIKTIMGTLIVYLIFSGAMLFPMMYHQLLMPHDHDFRLYSIILFYFRNPNHFVPSNFGTGNYILFIVLMLLGIGQLINRVRSQFRWFALFQFGIIIIGCLAYVLFFEVFNSYGIGKTQWFKSTMWITAFSSIFIGIAIKQRFLNKLNEQTILPKIRLICIIGIVCSLVLILNSSMIPIKKFQSRYMVGNYKKTDLTLMHEWIAANTDKDKIFLTSPSDFSFSCEAKRSLFIGYKAIIHEQFFMVPWYIKFRDVYAISLDRLDGKNALDAAEESYNTTLYDPERSRVNIDYRLIDASKCKYVDAFKKTIHQEGNYILTEF
ncbi:MAG: DUF6798 domain-containing protein [Bacteroidota bacterium]